jgi:hypothetical protein
MRLALLSSVFNTEWNALTDHVSNIINPLTPELNPSAQRCLTSFFTGDFAS